MDDEATKVQREKDLERIRQATRRLEERAKNVETLPQLGSIGEVDMSTIHKADWTTADLDPDQEKYRADWRRAIKNNDIKKIRQLVNEGADVDMMVQNGSCWLSGTYLASMGNHALSLKTLLELKANINRGWIQTSQTPLCGAAWFNEPDPLKILLEGQADLNIKSHPGEESGNQTALWIACQKGHTDIAKLLIEARTKVDIRAYPATYNQTALVVSCIQSKDKAGREVVEYLLAARADTEIPTYPKTTHQTALWVAMAYGKIDIVASLLAAKANLDYIGVSSSTNKKHDVIGIGEDQGKDDCVRLAKNHKRFYWKLVRLSRLIHIRLKRGGLPLIDAEQWLSEGEWRLRSSLTAET